VRCLKSSSKGILGIIFFTKISYFLSTPGKTLAICSSEIRLNGVVAFGVVAFGVVAFGVVAFGVVAFGVVAFGVVAFGVVVLAFLEFFFYYIYQFSPINNHIYHILFLLGVLNILCFFYLIGVILILCCPLYNYAINNI
jgi:hypothetical protein